ncbi:MAG TPA: DUF1570 domain-containing protein, partial [Kiritimatiellia bacterium]
DPSGLAREVAEAINAPVDLHSTKHFDVFHTMNGPWAEDAASVLESLYASYFAAAVQAGFAVRDPDQPLAWLCFNSDESFRTYGALFEGETEFPFDSYFSSYSDRIILLLPGGMSSDRFTATRVAHEAAHQLAYNTGLQTRGVHYPLWISEGLATAFENVLAAGLPFAADNPYRRRALAAARDNGLLLPLSDLVVATEVPADTEQRNAIYAQAWGLVHFLYEHKPGALRQYLALLAQYDAGRRPEAALRMEFEVAFGDPADIQSDWSGFLAALGGNEITAGIAHATPAVGTATALAD